MDTTTRLPAERPSITLDLVVLDTDDPAGLAEFYATLLGWRVTETEDDWVTIRGEGGPALGFQLAINHRRPTWPDNAVPQQIHLDLDVTDPEAAARFAESLGATRLPPQPGEPDSFTVFLDPSGHPFCLCRV